MIAPGPSRRGPRWRPVAFVLAGGALALFGLFFFAINDAWVAVRLPRLPWGSGPAFSDWEVHFAALILVPLAAGAVLAAALCRRAAAGHRRRADEHRDRAARLEVELEKISRLLTSSRSGDRPAP